MMLLALDQASRTSGWAVFKDGELIDSGAFTITDKNIGTRLNKIKQRVLELIESYKINEVIFEDIQLQKQINNAQTFKTLAEVIGVLIETFEERQIPYSSVLAVQWRSRLKIKGSKRAEQKKAAQAYIQEKYGKEVSEDESDAICIGVYASKEKATINWS